MIPIITVDGPSGVGKSTLCRELRNKLKWNLLDSGALYRTLALASLFKKVNLKDKKETEKILVSSIKDISLRFEIKMNRLNVFLKGKEISKIIKSEEIGNIASKIAVLPKIREAMVAYQHTYRVAPGLIADGRDMGTVVFPEAIIKIFLYASIKERVKRRMQQLKKNNFNVSLKNLFYEIKDRDIRDKNRTISPLLPANDAIIIDSTNMSTNEVTEKVLNYYNKLNNKL